MSDMAWGATCVHCNRTYFSALKPFLPSNDGFYLCGPCKETPEGRHSLYLYMKRRYVDSRKSK